MNVLNLGELSDANEDEDIDSLRKIDVDDADEDAGWRGEPFDPNLIDISVQAQSVSNIVVQMEEDEIDLSPAFQRSANIWSIKQQSRLIESILLRIPLPAFYFDVEVSTDELGIRRNYWHVIDGLQRLCSIRNFVANIPNNPNRFVLTDMEFLKKLEGHAFCELPKPYQRIIRETQLTVYLVKPNTPLNVKYNIFKRVNTGGVPLTQQEIRHALNQGVAADFLAELAGSEHFKVATQGRVKSVRMLDREFVNRFLAFYLLSRGDDEDMDAYYDRALRRIAAMPETERADIRKRFYDSLDILWKLFDKYAFCKLDRYPKTKPINKVLFEVMTVSVSRMSAGDRDALRQIDKTYALECYKELLSAESPLYDLVSTTTGDAARVAMRYEVVAGFLQSLIRREQ